MLGLEFEPLLHQLRHLWPISSHDLRLWGTVASSPVTGSLGGYARGTVLRWGTPGPRWGTVLRWGDAWSTLGNCATMGDAWSTLGNCATLGDAWSMLGNCATLGGRLVHAGETPGRLSSLLGCWCTRGPLSLSSVIEVKYVSRGPPYIAGSELLSRVSWCESQPLIGSSRSVSIRGAPECLGRFDVRYTSNPVM